MKVLIGLVVLIAIGFGVAYLAGGFSSESPEQQAQKFRAVALVNIHLEPSHMECLKRAVDEARKAGVSVCYADITRTRWADRLGAAFLQGDHAGAWETSLMMAAAPAMVSPHSAVGYACSIIGGKIGPQTKYAGSPYGRSSSPRRSRRRATMTGEVCRYRCPSISVCQGPPIGDALDRWVAWSRDVPSAHVICIVQSG